jgi:hypothetical protein
MLPRKDQFMSETRSVSRSVGAQPQLEIVQGLHAGVRLDLKDGEYSVGPTPNSDIVLRDKGVLPQHALLRIERGEVRVEATGGDVSVGNLKVAAGHGCRLRLPAVISLGEASLRLSRRSETDSKLFGRMKAAAKGLSDRPMEVAGSVLLCAVAVTVVSQAVPQSPPESAKSELAISAEAARAAVADDGIAVKVAHAAAAGSTVKQAAEELENRLRAAGIQSVRITADDQRVSAQGRVSEAQAAQWTAIQHWFDETHGSSVVLTANVATGPVGGPLLRLQSVWLGDRPYIIADNGSRYYEGSVLDSGWILQRIADDGLLLKKENETFALTYR